MCNLCGGCSGQCFNFLPAILLFLGALWFKFKKIVLVLVVVMLLGFTIYGVCEDSLQRSGFVCKRCGLCCETWNIWEHKPGRCKQLTYDKDGLAVCKVWGTKDYPEVCKNYPIHNRTCLREFKETGKYTID